MIDIDPLLVSVRTAMTTASAFSGLGERIFYDLVPEGQPQYPWCRISTVMIDFDGAYGGSTVDTITLQFSFFGQLDTVCALTKSTQVLFHGGTLSLADGRSIGTRRTGSDMASLNFSSKLPNGTSVYHAHCDLDFLVQS